MCDKSRLRVAETAGIAKSNGETRAKIMLACDGNKRDNVGTSGSGEKLWGKAVIILYEKPDSGGKYEHEISDNRQYRRYCRYM